MKIKPRLRITSITVFGSSLLLSVAVAASLYVGFNLAAESTRQLWAEQSETLINGIEQNLHNRLRPVRHQARWLSSEIINLDNPEQLDETILGSLAATPQVAAIAVIRPDGRSRRWQRNDRQIFDEYWRDRTWFEEYMALVATSTGSTWREPIFTDTINHSTLLLDTRLSDPEGNFIGVLAQIVPITELSKKMLANHAPADAIPFVLYNHDFVLAHPSISRGSEAQPLARLEELEDLVLARIWTPDEDADFVSAALKNTRASGIFWGDDYYLFLHRDIDQYGPSPWTIGAYLNTTPLIASAYQRLSRALAVGFAVLVIAIVAAIILGRKVSNPVSEIAQAAELVEAEKLDQIPAFSASGIRELDEAGQAFNKMVDGLRERQLIRDTLGRFVPEKVAASLLAGGGDIEVQQSEATILFCDIEAFTQLTERLGPVSIVEVLNEYFSAMVDILERHGGIVTQFQGDAILATFNVPLADAKHAHNAVASAIEMLACVNRQQFAGETLNIRIGINSGSVVAGAIGARGRLNYTVHGDAVNRAARLEALNKTHQTRLLVAASTVTQTNSFDFRPIGELEIRGQSEKVPVYTLASLESSD